MKKLLSVCIAIILIVSISVTPAYAADTASKEDVNKTIENTALKLERKYGIYISYPTNNKGNIMISENILEMLDRSFSTITPELVKQVSSYYENKTGRMIEIEFYFSNKGYSYNGGVLMAAFEPATAKIFVFLPSSAGHARISGENPIALVHEMGHAFHLMCMDLYGEEQMKSEWLKFNRGNRYNNKTLDNDFNRNIFISKYANTMYEEDFAETFGHTFVRTADGTGFSDRLAKNSQITGLGQKVNYIEKLIGDYIDKPDAAIENLRKIYNTPTSMTFEGVTFSGETLQFIGYPQPRNILKGILNVIGMESQKSTWVRALGAWRVTDEAGDMYYIFPGGTWVKAAKGQRSAA